MKQKLWIVLVCILMNVSPSFGQSFPNQKYCSSPDVSPPTLNIRETCTTYATCVTNDMSDASCYYDAFLQLLNTCQADNRSNCVELSTMYMAQFNAVVSAYEGDADTSFRLVWAFDANGFEAALNYYESYEYKYSVLEMMHGIILDAQGDAEQAILALTDSLAMDSGNPLIYYLRGQLYLEVDDLDRASYDFYTYSRLAPDDLIAELAVPEPIFTMPEDGETWVLYPVIQRIMGPGGTYLSDLTLSPAKNVQIVLSDDGETVAMTNLIDEETISFFTQDEFDATRYKLLKATQNINTPFAYYGSEYTQSYTLSSIDSYWELSSLTVGFESGGQSTSILAPIDAPDPRLDLERPCEGLPLSWITVGDALEAVNDMRMSPITIYSEPQADADMFEETMGFAEWWRDKEFPDIIVTGGPECGTDELWWEVTIADQVAWIPDNQSLLPDAIIRTMYNGVLPSATELLGLTNAD